MEESILEIEKIIQLDIGNRGIQTLCLTGELNKCARELHTAKSVAVVSGFCIPGCNPPTETDGPPGVVAIARALTALGKKVSVITDDTNEAIFRECIRAADLEVQLYAFPSRKTFLQEHQQDQQAGHNVDTLFETHSRNLAKRIIIEAGLDYLVAIERSGPAKDNESYNMRGISVTDMHGQVYRLFECGLKSSGVGDGGNEIGMGKVYDKVLAYVPYGDKIACRIPTDNLIVCGVSNWGGYAIAAALFLLTIANAATHAGHTEEIMNRMLPSVEEQRKVLGACVALGAVDGVLKKAEMSVDGFAFDDIHTRIIQDIRRICETAIATTDRQR